MILGAVSGYLSLNLTSAVSAYSITTLVDPPLLITLSKTETISELVTASSPSVSSSANSPMHHSDRMSRTSFDFSGS